MMREAADLDEEHIRCVGRGPCSNGKAEKAVQTVKNLLRKAQVENRDFHLALLDLHNSPTNDNIGSPVHRLMSRRTKTLLPTADNLLRKRKEGFTNGGRVGGRKGGREGGRIKE